MSEKQGPMFLVDTRKKEVTINFSVCDKDWFSDPTLVMSNAATLGKQREQDLLACVMMYGKSFLSGEL